ncbi:DUF6326 family protein [Cognatishimia sp. SS12]|uniref:DUF6326 family protein n=1 Tax=Cognatishimia sp. SS12 TaxID=2979465 RepID=UPI00232C60BF|nr:DUF6326 family protein [Cognatishimia sp. SS12]MDC0737055.1 DUF6326 family protein [Cognatishimia sp. SS12]
MSHPAPNRGQMLAMLWLFAILNILFRDIHELTIAANVEEILTGHVNGNPVTESVLLMGALAVEILLLAFVLSVLALPRWARRLNLGAAPVAGAGLFLGVPNDPDDIFFAVVVLVTLAVIFVLALRWPITEQAQSGAQND